MRFITEFELPAVLIDHPKREEYERVAGDRYGMCLYQSINEAFGWDEKGYLTEDAKLGVRYSIEIEAFPMDKWMLFKTKLFHRLMQDNMPTKYIDGLIEELESFGKPSGDTITNLSDQIEYRGPNSHCKACEDELNGIKYIMAQKHTCRKGQ